MKYLHLTEKGRAFCGTSVRSTYNRDVLLTILCGSGLWSRQQLHKFFLPGGEEFELRHEALDLTMDDLISEGYVEEV